MANNKNQDTRLIEAGFPCHQVGAETQRERGASSALPPLYYLHVWWARRPLTPSRAALLASLLPADTDPDWFLHQLGIEKHIVEINGQQWTLDMKDTVLVKRIFNAPDGTSYLRFDETVLRRLQKENQRREQNLELIATLIDKDKTMCRNPVILKWKKECNPICQPWPSLDDIIPIKIIPADPAWANERISFEKNLGIRTNEDKYGYERAFSIAPVVSKKSGLTILDPTAGGGSIPFEALRLGHNVIANELNPVASVILHATLDYPLRYGNDLIPPIKKWGERLRNSMVDSMIDLFPASRLHGNELYELERYLSNYSDLITDYLQETLDGFLYCRQVTCPHCGGEAPLLNTCWLSNDENNKWGVKIIIDNQTENGTVQFETYRVKKGKGPKGERPDFSTVNDGIGLCIHCRQAIEADEIKKQARGESDFGTWKDRLYCVVAVRFQPKLDTKGKLQRYKSGPKAGEIKTEKVRFFRTPNKTDLDALVKAEKQLKKNWDRWDAEGLIPTEKIPDGHKTKEPLRAGMTRWCDMFTPRQLLGHLILIEELNRLKPQILSELGEEKGKAVVTYLQFMIDKGVDYNSKQTRWITQRSQVSGTFGRHDFSLKWTFGEMIFSGENSGMAWAVEQIVDSYSGLAELVKQNKQSDIKIINSTAAHMPEIADNYVDLICMDPPYYNNVQYSELSDFYYVWQKRTLKDLYPDYFLRRYTNKKEEAVANPDRDAGNNKAKLAYENFMREIFSECKRVLNNDGLLTLMFTHKSQDAWETLTRSLIESGWVITSTFPVESEFANSQHLMDNASASSSIFITCRKRFSESASPSTWIGFGGTGVQQRIRSAVSEGLNEFAVLKLNPVDEMVASYGRALRVLSEHWPVLDGDDPVEPTRAMLEASRVVAEHQIQRITKGRLKVEDLVPEASMALTLYGVYGLNEFPFDEGLNLSRSLNIRLENRSAGYTVDDRFIGINTQSSSGRRTQRAQAEENGFHAPLIRKGSKLRLARPDERDPRRFTHPQTEWDILQGTIMAFREGDIPVARGYLDRHGKEKTERILDLLDVWETEMADEELRKEAQTLLFGLK